MRCYCKQFGQSIFDTSTSVSFLPLKTSERLTKCGKSRQVGWCLIDSLAPYRIRLSYSAYIRQWEYFIWCVRGFLNCLLLYLAFVAFVFILIRFQCIWHFSQCIRRFCEHITKKTYSLTKIQIDHYQQFFSNCLFSHTDSQKFGLSEPEQLQSGQMTFFFIYITRKSIDCNLFSFHYDTTGWHGWQ